MTRNELVALLVPIFKNAWLKANAKPGRLRVPGHRTEAGLNAVVAELERVGMLTRDLEPDGEHDLGEPEPGTDAFGM